MKTISREHMSREWSKNNRLDFFYNNYYFDHHHHHQHPDFPFTSVSGTTKRFLFDSQAWSRNHFFSSTPNSHGLKPFSKVVQYSILTYHLPTQQPHTTHIHTQIQSGCRPGARQCKYLRKFSGSVISRSLDGSRLVQSLTLARISMVSGKNNLFFRLGVCKSSNGRYHGHLS